MTNITSITPYRHFSQLASMKGENQKLPIAYLISPRVYVCSHCIIPITWQNETVSQVHLISANTRGGLMVVGTLMKQQMEFLTYHFSVERKSVSRNLKT